MSELEIVFLYDDLCTAKDEAWENLKQALEETGIQAKLKKQTTLEYAQRTFRFYPSPTILVNGEDIVGEKESCSSCGTG